MSSSRFGRWKITGPQLVEKIPRRMLLFSTGSLLLLIMLGLLVRLDLTVSIDGQTRPENWWEVRPGKDGVMAVFYVKEGDSVESGAIVGELANQEEREGVIRAEGRLASLKAERDRIVAELRLTEARQRTGVAEARAYVGERVAEAQEVQVGAHPEEIRQGEKSVESARLRLRQAEEDLARGEVLFRADAIPASDLERRHDEVQSARIGLEQSEASLRQTITRYRPHEFARVEARSTAARAGEASARAGVYAVELKRAELRAADEMVSSSEAELAIARAVLERTILRTGAAGRVLTGNLEDLIGKGFLPGQTILAVGDPDTIVVRARLPESKAADMAEGLGAKVFLAAYPHTRFKAFSGRVSRISPYYQTINWEALGIPEAEVTPEMQEAFTTATILLEDPHVEENGSRRIISPGLRARCDVLLDEGPVLLVALRYLRRGYRNIPNINFHL